MRGSELDDRREGRDRDTNHGHMLPRYLDCPVLYRVARGRFCGIGCNAQNCPRNAATPFAVGGIVPTLYRLTWAYFTRMAGCLGGPTGHRYSRNSSTVRLA